MSTEDTFFKGKCPWSKIKDAVLKDYLPPYLRKVAKLGRRIILIDAFAGPGIFESEKGEERLGSPLIICRAVERHVPGKYLAIFVNSNRNHHEILEKVIYGFASKDTVIPLLGTAQELLVEVNKVLTNQTLFIYLDPFGLKDCEFNLVKPFLERDISYSTEVLVNLSMPTLHRLATRRVQWNGRQTIRSNKLNEDLTKVLGGDYWKGIMWNDSLSAEDKELKVMGKYRELLKRYLPYTGSCPVREKAGKRIKYFITFCSRHPDAMLLMNDSMCKAYFRYMHEMEFEGTLFETTDWNEMRSLSSLKEIILGEVNREPGRARLEIWKSIVQAHFMRFHSSEYKKAVKLLVSGSLEYKNPKETGRLNDDCLLFPKNNNSTQPSRGRLLIKESITVCPKIKREPYRKIKIHFDRYKMLDGTSRILAKQVADGSIITRFDKTPYPVKPTDVVCPHFLELKWAYGCPFDCSWCYLKGTFRFRPEGIKPGYKPLEKVRLHMETFLQEVETPEILNTGEIADSLMQENGDCPFSKFIISMFERQNGHKVLFVTKSTNIKNLLEVGSPSQVVISFSLNAEPVASKWEKRAPLVKKRIEAAKKITDAGYEVRIRIDPMVPIESWEGCYIQLVDEIFSRFIPKRITLGSLRGLQSTINGTNDTSWVKYLKESSNWGRKIDFTTRYRIYKTIIGYLNSRYDYYDIALCKETKAMWEKLRMDWTQIECNCVW